MRHYATSAFSLTYSFHGDLFIIFFVTFLPFMHHVKPKLNSQFMPVGAYHAFTLRATKSMYRHHASYFAVSQITP